MATDVLTRATVRDLSGVTPRIPSVAGLLARLALLKLALSVAGFARTRAWMGRRATLARSMQAGRTAPEPAWIAEAERAVATAAALFPGRAECLERSLLLHWLLRRRGVPCEMRLGVQLHPFLAHAWVELDGAVLNDVAEHVAQFTPVDEVAS